MSKELSPLEALSKLYLAYGPAHQITFKKRYKLKEIIKAALKDYEKKTKLAKEYADVDNVAKRLKALEIIKEKQVNVQWIMVCDTYKDYYKRFNEFFIEYLTQEEFDLLKEVLK